MAENIPVIDFSAYSLDRAEPDHDRFQGLIDDIHGALTTVGGLYLKNFGIPVEKVFCLCINDILHVKVYNKGISGTY